MKLSKSLVAAIVALVLVLGCGVVEIVVMRNRYLVLDDQCHEIIEQINNETLTGQRFKLFREDWEKLREVSEFLLPTLDIYEMNLRIAEAHAFVEKKDWTAAYAQMKIVCELLEYIPQKMIPSHRNVF